MKTLLVLVALDVAAATAMVTSATSLFAGDTPGVSQLADGDNDKTDYLPVDSVWRGKQFVKTPNDSEADVRVTVKKGDGKRLELRVVNDTKAAWVWEVEVKGKEIRVAAIRPVKKGINKKGEMPNFDDVKGRGKVDGKTLQIEYSATLNGPNRKNQPTNGSLQLERLEGDDAK